ncbi:MAG: hypothetical protein N3B18_05980 [Desulfobacterota bacterium]|nr:hypothetical protein [Thermodesulfobacteriota bacterium]
MDKEFFLKNYIKPATVHFNETFRLPLPPIPELTKAGDFIVQGSTGDTYSTNIITTYENKDGIRFVEVYKNTENSATGIFIRLTGSMSLVKRGYPLAVLDAAVSNVSPFTFQKEDLSTRIAIHFPQSDIAMRDLFFTSLSRDADAHGIASALHKTPALPAFWGAFMSVHLSGIALAKISTMRDIVWRAYDACCRTFAPQENFDYGPALEQIVFKNARTEHHIFQKMGLSVAIEAQSAFFSILTAGVYAW